MEVVRMRLNYAFEATPDVLMVKAGGAYEPAAAEAMINAIVEQCRRTGLRRVLLDAAKLEGSPSNLERYRIGIHIAERMRAVRMAVVDGGGAIDKFVEDVAVNRGAQLLATSDREQAVLWLGAGLGGDGDGS
jgi:hypothetical protein